MKAIISVSDKTGVVEFAQALQALGWEIISTSGSLKALEAGGVRVTAVSEVTGFPEICDGRVKTLHPRIHGGLLARRDKPSHMKALAENGIEPVDLVCVNLYPFKQTIAREGVSLAEAIENIDIGGPSMLRSAAKNWESVTVVCDPADYEPVLKQVKAGGIPRETRLRLSAKAYTHTAEYDMAIAAYMRAQASLPEKLFLEYELRQELRYGENPHQQAGFYSTGIPEPYSLACAEQLNGKELSYNNIQDANAALNIVREFTREPFCCGVKHMNPCGAAAGATIMEAWKKAYEGDKTSIFGGIVAANREIDLATAELLKPVFLEIVMAPSFAPDALELLRSKKNLRILKIGMTAEGDGGKGSGRQLLSVNGGLLVQDRDSSTVSLSAEMCVTAAKPGETELSDLGFVWKIVKHVKSNAIVVGRDGMTYGIGAGQMNRVASVEIALREAAAKLAAETGTLSPPPADEDLKSLVRKAGLVLASDGFFPFDDCVALAAEYGIRAIVQPGGSIRDEDSVKKADEHGIAMLFTHERHFKH